MADRTFDDLVFFAFKGGVAALDRYEGDVLWQWAPPKGAGVISMLLDGDRLMVSTGGSLYCLDPRDGQQVWDSELPKGAKSVTGLVSVHGSVRSEPAAVEAAKQQHAVVISSMAGGLGPLIALIL